MVPICMARGLADGRRQELPGALQRFAPRVAGLGRRPAVVRQPAAVAPRAYGPLAI
jgi:hypothetical protein